MSRLVVVSNRLPSLRPAERGREPEVPAGGLASALLGALQGVPGSLWFGWSGRVAAGPSAPALRRVRLGDVELVGLALRADEVEGYYRGFCNGALWPLLHCFQSLVRLGDNEAMYRRVQQRFAAALLPLLRADDLVWVHDYHLALLGRELRRAGWTGRLGFFLHTPFPPHELWQLLPDPADFLAALLEHDVVGFHTRGFRDNYVHCCRRELGARWREPWLSARGRVQHVDTYPIGIEPHDFLPPAAAPEQTDDLKRVVRGRRLLLGVDRLDYTKGIPERILAFETFVRRHAAWRKRVSFVQIASPSRADVPQYAEQKQRVESLVGRVNGELAEHDWVPIRYLYRNYSREVLARFYREADVMLVTPLRDGMNLVAKEFVAAQYPGSPGVLLLSRCAGAAEELPEAVLVNPYNPADVAAAIARALDMPLAERQRRHAALLRRVRANTAGEWAARFTAMLAEAKPRRVASARVASPPRG